MASEHAVPTVPPAAPALDDPTLGRLILAATRRHSGAAIRYRRPDGHWADWSYDELGTRIRALARGIVATGIQPGERISILASTSKEWTVADAAILAAGCVVVPIYHTNSPEECRHVIGHSGSRAVLVEDAAQAAKIEAIRGDCPDLEHVWSFADVPGVTTADELAASGSGIDVAVLDERLGHVGPEDIATIVYTSGTTGLPKGCMLSHRAFRATVDMYEQQVDLSPPAVVYLFLPLAHALARVASWVVLHKGATIAYWRGDVSKLVDDLGEVKPTHFPSVPRVFEKINTKAVAAAADGGPIKKALFDWAVATGRRARAARRAGTLSSGLRLQHEIADRLVLSKVRGLFGGHLKLGLV
ncbi:MAG TPA: AMP-binding protein, partial [Solirubrobacteraceae bacterium]|nr:AMP-binding protein [Solirubrobacteraceae bacterium]